MSIVNAREIEIEREIEYVLILCNSFFILFIDAGKSTIGGHIM